jgi:oligopeptide/dipeptide ABC transporter ATP-binding protein
MTRKPHVGVPLATPLLEVKNLKTQFRVDEGTFNAVDDISFQLEEGRSLGIVGESGCGKSVTSLSIMRLIQKPGQIVGGEILFRGKDLLKNSEEQMRQIRGDEIAMIFQEPMTSLNPVYTIGDQIDEAIEQHNPQLKKSEIKSRTLEILKKVGIPAPEKRYQEFPHQLSGGMRQRVMIAIAISCNPDLLIADEPTTALDVTIQAQILDLIRKLQKEFKAGLILITHDLGVVAEMCQEVAVMYTGRIIEYGTVEDIFYRPQHPYTRGLLDSIPHLDAGLEDRSQRPALKTIQGLVPSMLNLPHGCRFRERCPRASEICAQKYPEMTVIGTQKFACHHPLGAVQDGAEGGAQP